jgi:hypothetical protein
LAGTGRFFFLWTGFWREIKPATSTQTKDNPTNNNVHESPSLLIGNQIDAAALRQNIN